MKKIEYYTVRPNLKQIYGKKVDKSTSFIEQTEDGRVHQEFKDLKLITKIKSNDKVNGYTIDEESKIEVAVPEGTILIWNEQEGFIIPQVQVCTLEEIENQIKDIKDIYEGDSNDSKRDENKDI